MIPDELIKVGEVVVGIAALLTLLALAWWLLKH